jgi:hypothetical protein
MPLALDSKRETPRHRWESMESPLADGQATKEAALKAFTVVAEFSVEQHLKCDYYDRPCGHPTRTCTRILLVSPETCGTDEWSLTDSSGKALRALPMIVYNLENPDQLSNFLKSSSREIDVYGLPQQVSYDPEMRIGMGVTRMGASKATSICTYVLALRELDS